MPAASFRAMKGVRASLEDAPINAPFAVISYDISVYGLPGTNGPLTASNKGGFWEGNAAVVANKVQAGATVTISKIIVMGPDKIPRPANNSVILIKIT